RRRDQDLAVEEERVLLSLCEAHDFAADRAALAHGTELAELDGVLAPADHPDALAVLRGAVEEDDVILAALVMLVVHLSKCCTNGAPKLGQCSALPVTPTAGAAPEAHSLAEPASLRPDPQTCRPSPRRMGSHRSQEGSGHESSRRRNQHQERRHAAFGA